MQPFATALLPRTLAGVVLALCCAPLYSQTSVITHVRVLDGSGHRASLDKTVTIVGDRIQAIAPSGRHAQQLTGARVIDGRGLTMLPGLINAHGHLGLVEGSENRADAYTVSNVMGELRQYEHYGVLDMLSLGLNRDLIYRIRGQQQAGTLDGATVFVADHGIGVPGGAPPLPHAPDQLDQPGTPEEARRDVDAAAARHTNFIKIWVDDLYGTKPKMQPAIYLAVIDEAHKQHLPVAAHVYYLADAKALVAAGIGVLAHSVRDKPVDAELIHLMKQHGTWYLPTLTVDESFFVFADHPELLNDPFVTRATSPAELAVLRSPTYRTKVAADPNMAHHRADLSMASKNLLRVYRAGVHVGFGTDSGANPLRLPGYAEHRELALMVAAGLTPLEALRCATANNAMLLGIDKQTGTLATGMKADFLLVQGDPARTITDTRKMVSIWHNGGEGKPWATEASSPSQP